MPRLTATVSVKQKNWVEAEASARQISEAELVRELLDEARGISDEQDLASRVADLEGRVEALEARRSTSDARDDAPRSESEASDPMHDEVRMMQLPGDGETLTQRREAAVSLLQWLERRGSAQRSDIERDWLDNDLGYGSDDARWGKYLRQVLKQSDRVEKRKRTWHWIGRP